MVTVEFQTDKPEIAVQDPTEQPKQTPSLLKTAEEEC